MTGLQEISILSIFARMLLAVLCGGLIGLEREYKRRPAGFRTHILICLGAAMTTLTSQYLFLYMHYYTDMARLGAQVVAGIGFIGAGTIIVTRRQHVKGLTTAAGLWTAAIVGLCIGSGFYEGGLWTTGLVLLAELLFLKLEYFMQKNTPEVNVYMEYSNQQCVSSVISLLQSEKIKIVNMEIMRTVANENGMANALLLLRLVKKTNLSSLLARIEAIQGISCVEEL